MLIYTEKSLISRKKYMHFHASKLKACVKTDNLKNFKNSQKCDIETTSSQNFDGYHKNLTRLCYILDFVKKYSKSFEKCYENLKTRPFSFTSC